MTESQFRKAALSFSEAIESEHMQHPDFRAGGKIFASLPKPAEKIAMVKLSPEQQASFMKLDAAFSPCAGAWGTRGYTNIELPSAKTDIVKSALELAYQGVVAATKKTTKKKPAKKKASNKASSTTRS